MAPLGQPLPLIIAGPTGVGKSDAAMVVAESLGGEIVSVDALQVYVGMDIGTGKPGPGERRRVVHHLLDVAGLGDQFSAGSFTRLARATIEDIQRRQRVPILCGGTGLYFKALFEGLGDTPPAQPAIRSDLARTPLDVLLRELGIRDPETFRQIDRRNRRRVLRAVEIIRASARGASDLKAAWRRGGVDTPPAVGLRRARAVLCSRIERRVEAMFQAGLVEETRALLRHGLAENQTARQAIGYRQVIDYLRGTCSLPEAIALVKTRTRQLAKRQMTWFRRQMRLRWIDWQPEWGPQEVAGQIMEYYRGRTATAADSSCEALAEDIPSPQQPWPGP